MTFQLFETTNLRYHMMQRQDKCDLKTAFCLLHFCAFLLRGHTQAWVKGHDDDNVDGDGDDNYGDGDEHDNGDEDENNDHHAAHLWQFEKSRFVERETRWSGCCLMGKIKIRMITTSQNFEENDGCRLNLQAPSLNLSTQLTPFVIIPLNPLGQ